MWDLIVSVPDHCLSFYFTKVAKGLKRFPLILIKLTPVERPRNFELKRTCILERK